jgi:hypothetical protein
MLSWARIQRSATGISALVRSVRARPPGIPTPDPCTRRHRAGWGHAASPDEYLVAQPCGRSSRCIDQRNLAITYGDAPPRAARRRRLPVLDADHQAVRRSIDLKCSDQLSLHYDGWSSTLNREARYPTNLSRPLPLLIRPSPGVSKWSS